MELDESKWVPENESTDVYYWEMYKEYLLVARYIKRPRLPHGTTIKQERDYGYWCGYVGHKTHDLEDLTIHRGPRSRMYSGVIPKLDIKMKLIGFNGKNFNDHNISPSGQQGHFIETDKNSIVILTKESVMNILKEAINNPVKRIEAEVRIRMIKTFDD